MPKPPAFASHFLPGRSDAQHDFCATSYTNPTFINVWDQKEALAKIESALSAQAGFVFNTMNLDHLCKLRRFANFRPLYARADLVSADGWPIALFARRPNARIVCVTGADLILPVCRLAGSNGYPVFLFGATKGALDKAATKLEESCIGLKVIGKIAPPPGFDPYSRSAREIASKVAFSGARVCFIALGAPTQEAFADIAREAAPSIGFLCIGAGLDFIAGTQRRAPKFMREAGIEWLWRWAGSPRRLTKRYIQSIRMFVALLFERACGLK